MHLLTSTHIFKFTQWFCTIVSVEGFGESCGLFKDTITTLSALTIANSTLTADVIYSFEVIVSSPDGRSASKSVRVTATALINIIPTISNDYVRFNVDTKLVLNGFISGTEAVVSQWRVLTQDGVNVPVAARTPLSATFSKEDVILKAPFPLSVSSFSLRGGTLYTFRMTAAPQSTPTLITYTDVTLYANMPPAGGYISTSPKSGDALMTDFLIMAPDWTSDAGSLPLSYSFAFRVSTVSAYLTLATSSLRAYVISTLPAGLRALDDHVTLRGKISDIYSAASTATGSVQVLHNAALNVSNYLESSLSTALAFGNIDQLYRAINNVSPSSA